MRSIKSQFFGAYIHQGQGDGQGEVEAEPFKERKKTG